MGSCADRQQTDSSSLWALSHPAFLEGKTRVRRSKLVYSDYVQCFFRNVHNYPVLLHLTCVFLFTVLCNYLALKIL